MGRSYSRSRRREPSRRRDSRRRDSRTRDSSRKPSWPDRRRSPSRRRSRSDRRRLASPARRRRSPSARKERYSASPPRRQRSPSARKERQSETPSRRRRSPSPSPRAKSKSPPPRREQPVEDGETIAEVVPAAPKPGGELTSWQAELQAPRPGAVHRPEQKAMKVIIRGPIRVSKERAKEDLDKLVDAYKKGGLAAARKLQGEMKAKRLD
mmetsp:Transcript_30152/g.82872  ORF Transcript_30152/g.82872 Transcript_30152/m.82872 type:complete len:210 (-) Transcript_30152:127-756(-)